MNRGKNEIAMFVQNVEYARVPALFGQVWHHRRLHPILHGERFAYRGLVLCDRQMTIHLRNFYIRGELLLSEISYDAIYIKAQLVANICYYIFLKNNKYLVTSFAY